MKVIVFIFLLTIKMSFTSNLRHLINHLKINGYIKSERVEETMLLIDRGHYIESYAYEDSPQFIGYGVTISAPHMHATALEKLLPKLVPGAKILDVGSGSGYLTACLAHMVSPDGKAVGIDHIAELVDKSISNVNKCPVAKQLLLSNQLQLVLGDGRKGYVTEAPYDAIHIGAGADYIPQELKDQLKVGGILVAPVGQQGNQMFMKITKVTPTQFDTEEYFPVRYVPLTDAEKQLKQDL